FAFAKSGNGLFRVTVFTSVKKYARLNSFLVEVGNGKQSMVDASQIMARNQYHFITSLNEVGYHILFVQRNQQTTGTFYQQSFGLWSGDFVEINIYSVNFCGSMRRKWLFQSVGFGVKLDFRFT